MKRAILVVIGCVVLAVLGVCVISQIPPNTDLDRAQRVTDNIATARLMERFADAAAGIPPWQSNLDDTLQAWQKKVGASGFIRYDRNGWSAGYNRSGHEVVSFWASDSVWLRRCIDIVSKQALRQTNGYDPTSQP